MHSFDQKMDRRGFLRRASAAAGGIVTATTIGALAAHSAWARESEGERRREGRSGPGYGPLKRVADQNGAEVLALPDGFHYVTFGRTGQVMSDGYPTPRNHDGMTCLGLDRHVVRLIRNHELRNAAGDFNAGVIGPEATRYDRKGMGGCVSLDFDTHRKELVRDFISLNGTVVNCSGGLAYQDAGWLTCEETTSGPAQGFDRPHGYAFFVSRDADYPLPARPITAMGRFSREAAVADNGGGIVYQTEDAGNDSGFYRYLPDDPARLIRGGTLQMLKIAGMSNYDTRTRQTAGVELPVEWVTIDDPDPDPVTPATSCFAQGLAKGGARFNRLEGVVRGENGAMYFTSTSGGNAQRGQLWKYIPNLTVGGALVLAFESPHGAVLDSPDNICVTPSGGIIFCEDDASNDNDSHPLAPGFVNVDRLVGLSPDGRPFEFAVNVHNQTEFAGACFSPDGEILFVNIFGNGDAGSGLTCAIWGPWHRGPL
jgi:secreted PhoX family phosphatase